MTAGPGENIRVGFFVERMRRDGYRRAFPDRVQRFELEPIVRQLPEHTVRPASRRGADRRAFKDFPQMQREGAIEAVADRQRGEDARIVGTAGEDNVRNLRLLLFPPPPP